MMLTLLALMSEQASIPFGRTDQILLIEFELPDGFPASSDQASPQRNLYVGIFIVGPDKCARDEGPF